MRPFLNLLFLFLFSASAVANTPVDRLKRFIADTKTLRADFMQLTLNENGGTSKQSKGVFTLQRPGKFRWDYTEPFHQEIVSDGDKVWFYDEDLEQVTVKSIDETLGSTPAVLLSGEIDLEHKFYMQQQGVDVGLHWVRLVPKSEETGFSYILIGMEGDRLGGMELKDSFGQLTRIYFSNIELDIAVDPGTFDFQVPPGADVFGQ